MDLRSVTIWLSVLMIAMPNVPLCLGAVLSGNITSITEVFMAVYMVGLFFGPCILTILIALFAKQRPTQWFLLIHILGYIGLACCIVLLILAEALYSHAESSAAPWALFFLPMYFAFVSPFFLIPAIITEIVLRYKDKNKVPEV